MKDTDGLAESLFNVHRLPGGKYWRELTQREQQRWERVAHHVDGIAQGRVRRAAQSILVAAGGSGAYPSDTDPLEYALAVVRKLEADREHLAEWISNVREAIGDTTQFRSPSGVATDVRRLVAEVDRLKSQPRELDPASVEDGKAVRDYLNKAASINGDSFLAADLARAQVVVEEFFTDLEQPERREMIEKAARVYHDSLKSPLGPRKPWNDLPDRARRNHLTAAEAALRAAGVIDDE